MSIGASLALIAAVAFVVTYLMVPVSIKLAHKVGAIDQPGDRHVHKHPTPRLGGVAMATGILVAAALAVGLSLTHHLPYVLNLPRNINVFGCAAGLAVVFIMGVIDDIRQLPAIWKFIAQIVASVILICSGVLLTDIITFSGAVFLSFGWVSYPLTALYLIAFANIVNLIDGLDGLAAGVCGISALAFFALSIIKNNWSTAVMAVIVVAVCLAFLRFNFHPAKVFMGDSGSQTLGLFLGMISIVGVMRASTITSFAVPIIIAGIPVLDTLAAIVRRGREHVSIASPDKGHIHHSLMRMGMGQRRVVLFIYLICAVFAASGVVIADTGLAVRIVVMAVDLTLAAILIWRLGLFGPVLRRYYPEQTADPSEQVADPGSPEGSGSLDGSSAGSSKQTADPISLSGEED